jgi:hypothetical protein
MRGSLLRQFCKPAKSKPYWKPGGFERYDVELKANCKAANTLVRIDIAEKELAIQRAE